MIKKKLITIGIAALLLGGFVGAVSASNSWGDYHWGRTANLFTLELGDNVSSKWDGHLNTSAVDWSSADDFDTVVVSGTTNPKRCRASLGRVEVCSSKYGFTNWLGIAQIWVNGGHIVKGAVKVNDTYFDTPTYNTLAWRNFVMCQEIGHTLGLDHQDIDFYNTNLNTCMDYTIAPESNQHPNAHDYAILSTIYTHLDSVDTVGPFPEEDKPGNKGRGKKNNAEWGIAISQDAQSRDSVFVKKTGHNEKVVTFVYWTQ